MINKLVNENNLAKAPVSTRAVLLFFGSMALGGIVLFIVFASAFAGTDSDDLVIVLWCGGGFIVSAVLSAIQPTERFIWSIGFSLPMFGWGVLCAAVAPINDWGVLWWTSYGFAAAAAAVLGAFVGRLASRR